MYAVIITIQNFYLARIRETRIYLTQFLYIEERRDIIMKEKRQRDPLNTRNIHLENVTKQKEGQNFRFKFC